MRAASADVFVVHRADSGAAAVFQLASRLRKEGVATVLGESGRSFKSQMRSADASGARIAVIIGEDELASGTATVKELRGGTEQQTVALGDVAGVLAVRLRPS